MELMIIGIGGMAGALARYMVGKVVGTYYSRSFPLATFLINMTGSFLLGLSFAHVAGLPLQQILLERYGFQIGFLGAYTTHSTFAFESIRLMEAGEWTEFILYVGGSMIVGLLSCGIGYVCGR